jgi:Raf kinase inhibitor-like YbhB/YbcL family protein
LRGAPLVRDLLCSGGMRPFLPPLGALVFLAGLGACGDDATVPTPDAATPTPDAAHADFVLSSPAVIPGQLVDDRYTCAGANVSPPLAWTPGPAATKSYAVVFTDLDNGPGGFLHSAIWDVAATTTALPEHVENAAHPAVPAGAQQARGYDGQTYGYLGPCPGTVHHYQFKLYALDAAGLPGITTESSLEEVQAAATSHALATATLDLQSD